MKDYSVLFASDEGYVPHMATAIYSLLLNNRRSLFKVYIFTTYISSSDTLKLESIASQFGSKIIISILDESLFYELPLCFHYQKSNYYRLLAADLIDDDKCLYLDSDVIVVGDICKLFEIELNEFLVAAVEDPGFFEHNKLGLEPNAKYFNSGVMLINLTAWRKYSLREEVYNFIRGNPSKIQFVDQCGLNGVINGRWLELPAHYNVQTTFIDGQLPAGYESLSEILMNVAIIHYSGSSKPWQLNNTHVFKNLYYKYRDKTPYRRLFPVGISMKNIGRLLIDIFVNIFKGRS